jgi:F-type H+-transporting ATPase subunit b
MISINATLIVQIINLLVLILILNRLMYKPIKRIMAEREQKMKADQAEAERIRQEAAQNEQTYRSELMQGRAAIRQRLAELRQEADHQVRQILEQAQQEAKKHQAEMRARIEEEINQARKDIRAEAEKVALSLAHTLLGREVA